MQLSNFQDNAYGTNIAGMNGTYTLQKLGVAQVNDFLLGSVWEALYTASRVVSDNGFPVVGEIELRIFCASSGTEVQYYNFLRYDGVFGVNARGTLRSAPPGCYSETSSGGNPSFISGVFAVTCNPLP